MYIKEEISKKRLSWSDNNDMINKKIVKTIVEAVLFGLCKSDINNIKKITILENWENKLETFPKTKKSRQITKKINRYLFINAYFTILKLIAIFS